MTLSTDNPGPAHDHDLGDIAAINQIAGESVEIEIITEGFLQSVEYAHVIDILSRVIFRRALEQYHIVDLIDRIGWRYSDIVEEIDGL